MVLHVGDKVFASNNCHHLNGVIVYGYCPKKHDYTDQFGATIDPREVIAIQVERDDERVRLNGNSWYMEPWTQLIPINDNGRPSGKAIALAR